MTDIQLPAEVLTPLPEEMYSHMRDMNPKSFEFQQDLDVLNVMARECGHAALTLEHIFPLVEQDAPEGFSSSLLIPNGANIPTEQFKGVIFSLASAEKQLTPDVQVLTTDIGRSVRLLDLRPFMTSRVRGEGPESVKERDRLDRSFYQDLKYFAEHGRARNALVSHTGIKYTKLGGTKSRAFWMPVSDSTSDGIPAIARIADNRNSIAAEKDLHRRVFKIE